MNTEQNSSSGSRRDIVNLMVGEKSFCNKEHLASEGASDFDSHLSSLDIVIAFNGENEKIHPVEHELSGCYYHDNWNMI